MGPFLTNNPILPNFPCGSGLVQWCWCCIPQGSFGCYRSAEGWAFPGQMGVGSVSYARSMPPFFCSQEQTLAAPFLDLSKPIGTALVLPWRKEKASPSPQQQPNPYAGFRLSQPVLLQCKSGLCTHF